MILMPALGIAKQRLADAMGSAATAGEGRQNMLRGEGCCVGSPLDGVGFSDDPCEDDCCR